MRNTTLIATLSLGLLALSACGEEKIDDTSSTGDDTGTPEEFQPFYAYELVAVVPNATVDDVARDLASYVHEVEDSTTGLPGDWVLGGGDELEEGADVMGAVLNMPGGGKVLDVCNQAYATQAMSFGPSHGIALPCAISLHQDEASGDVHVTLLEPAAIFNLFFADIPSEYMEQMGGLVTTVGDELRSLIHAGVTGDEVSYPATPMGPEFTLDSIAELAGYEYNISYSVTMPEGWGDGGAWLTEVTDTLLETLTYEGMDHVGATVEGLSTDDWRAARAYALGLPTGVKLVEVCSPTYATMALSTGYHHASSLPCQVGLYADENGDVTVDVLDPGFIFAVFFSDIPEEMAGDMGGLATQVRDDILAIVEAALESLEEAD